MDKTIKIRTFVITTIIIAAAGYYAWTTITARLYGDKIFASGTIEATEVDIAPKITGRIEEFYKNEGEFVKNGDQLCKIFSPELDITLKQAKSNLSGAKSAYQNAKADYDRIKSLYEDNLAGRQQYDSAAAASIITKSKYEQAQASVELAQLQISDTIISAPINGVLSKKINNIGELVFPGTPIYTLSDLSDIWLMIYIPEKDIGRIKYGGKVNVNIDSFPGKIFEGSIKYIASEAEFTPKNIQTKEERIKQVFGVKVSLPNPDNSLKPGMPADAEIN